MQWCCRKFLRCSRVCGYSPTIKVAHRLSHYSFSRITIIVIQSTRNLTRPLSSIQFCFFLKFQYWAHFNKVGNKKKNWWHQKTFKTCPFLLYKGYAISFLFFVLWTIFRFSSKNKKYQGKVWAKLQIGGRWLGDGRFQEDKGKSTCRWRPPPSSPLFQTALRLRVRLWQEEVKGAFYESQNEGERSGRGDVLLLWLGSTHKLCYSVKTFYSIIAWVKQLKASFFGRYRLFQQQIDQDKEIKGVDTLIALNFVGFCTLFGSYFTFFLFTRSNSWFYDSKGQGTTINNTYARECLEKAAALVNLFYRLFLEESSEEKKGARLEL